MEENHSAFRVEQELTGFMGHVNKRGCGPFFFFDSNCNLPTLLEHITSKVATCTRIVFRILFGSGRGILKWPHWSPEAAECISVKGFSE